MLKNAEKGIITCNSQQAKWVRLLMNTKLLIGQWYMKLYIIHTGLIIEILVQYWPISNIESLQLFLYLSSLQQYYYSIDLTIEITLKSTQHS